MWWPFRAPEPPLPAAEVHRVTREVVGPPLAAMGFNQRSDGTFTRRVDPDVVQLVRVSATKSYSRTLAWGAALAFMPASFHPRVHFARSESTAKFHLRVAPFFGSDQGVRANRAMAVSSFVSEPTYRDSISRLWSGPLGDRARAWLDQGRTISGLVELAGAQADQEGGMFHIPRPRLVQAFLLARLGRLEESRAAFDLYVGTWPTSSPAEIEAEKSALAAVSPALRG